jgi:hypothetical protein
VTGSGKIGTMAIVLPIPLTVSEMRVLQEFRRISAETLGLAAIKAIKHPAGGGEGPALTLIEKGYLTADGPREAFTLTDKAKAFLAINYVPEVESATADEA